MGAGAAPPPPRSSARRARVGRPHAHRSLVDVLTLLCCVLRHARVQMGRRLTGFGFRHPLEATRLRQIPCCAVVVGQESNGWSFKGDVDLAKATVLNRLYQSTMMDWMLSTARRQASPCCRSPPSRLAWTRPNSTPPLRLSLGAPSSSPSRQRSTATAPAWPPRRLWSSAAAADGCGSRTAAAAVFSTQSAREAAPSPLLSGGRPDPAMLCPPPC
jgi:hypothetical protein